MGVILRLRNGVWPGTLEIATIAKIRNGSETAGRMASNVPVCSQSFIWGCLAIVEDFKAWPAQGQTDFWTTFDFTFDLEYV